MLTLETKPDLEATLRRWEHFWHGELDRRPVVLTEVAKENVHPADVVTPGRSRYDHALNGPWKERLDLIDRWLEQVCFPGEKVPSVSPDLGPDQWAAFFGAELQFSKDSPQTNWVEPVVEDWNDVLPLKFNPQNPYFQRLLGYAECLARHGKGRYLVQKLDAHSNADALSALRGAERFMLDLYDCPDQVEQALRDMRSSYKTIMDALARAGRMGEGRGFTQQGFWHAGSFQVVQSDVICMIGRDHFRRLILPALEEEIAAHDRAYFHLDGPGALRHLDDLLKIPGFWVLQWVPGDGLPPNWKWLEVLQKTQAAGKAVHVFGPGLDIGALQWLHRELDPARVAYSPELRTESEAVELITWLERNT